MRWVSPLFKGGFMFDDNFYLRAFDNTSMTKRELEHFLKKEMKVPCQQAKYIASKCGRNPETAKAKESFFKNLVGRLHACGK